MPILPTEPDLHAQHAWPRDLTGGGRWWCLHTKPRQEKAVARELRDRDACFYLPTLLRDSVTPRGRRLRSSLPLFPGYVFLHGLEEQRRLALQGNRIVNILDVADQPAFDQDLRRIHRLLDSGLLVVPETGVPPGAGVRITSGPLAGLEGTVVKQGRNHRFVVLVRFLGRGANVDLLDWQIEPI
jgi:transcriptional antiterminator RfaH